MLTLEADRTVTRPRPSLIRYPRAESELHTQTRLLVALEDAILRAYPDEPNRYRICAHVKARPHPSAQSRGACNCYIDLVLFEFAPDRLSDLYPGVQARILIEIKRQANPTGMFHALDLARAERQCQRYAAYGLPVLLCWGPEDIPETVAETLRLLAEIGA
jgi:hypothetical protein